MDSRFLPAIPAFSPSFPRKRESRNQPRRSLEIKPARKEQRQRKGRGFNPPPDLWRACGNLQGRKPRRSMRLEQDLEIIHRQPEGAFEGVPPIRPPRQQRVIAQNRPLARAGREQLRAAIMGAECDQKSFRQVSISLNNLSRLLARLAIRSRSLSYEVASVASALSSVKFRAPSQSHRGAYSR